MRGKHQLVNNTHHAETDETVLQSGLIHYNIDGFAPPVLANKHGPKPAGSHDDTEPTEASPLKVRICLCF